MKTVSFKVAEAIKAAGYPPFRRDLSDCYGNVSSDVVTHRQILPTYFDVWLWLSDKKHIFIDVKHHCTNCVEAYVETKICDKGRVFNEDNVENGIIKAIDYLVDNNLIK